MSESSLERIAENYAHAVFHNLGQDVDGYTLLGCLDLVVRSMDEERDTWNLFLSKMVDSKTRLSFVQRFFEDELVRRFFTLIEVNSRWRLLPLILYYYDEMQLRSRGAVAAILLVSHPISKSKEAEMLKFVESLVNSSVRMRVHQDASLLGGFRIRVGHWLIDNSVKYKLGRIKSLANSE